MDNQLSVIEGLMVFAQVDDRIDETNIVGAVRHAQQVIMDDTGWDLLALFSPRSEEDVDSILIGTSRNGDRDLFFEDYA